MERDQEAESQMLQEFVRLWSRNELTATLAIVIVYVLLVAFASIALYWDHPQVAIAVIAIAFGSTTVSAAIKVAIRRWSRPDSDRQAQPDSSLLCQFPISKPPPHPAATHKSHLI